MFKTSVWSVFPGRLRLILAKKPLRGTLLVYSLDMVERCQEPPQISRRQILAAAGGGVGMLALRSLVADDQPTRKKSPLAARQPHFQPRAKRVIWLFMHGGPSHVDLFDPKPDLVKYAGHPLPDHAAIDARDLAFGDDDAVVMTEKDAVKCVSIAAVDAWYVPVDVGELDAAFLEDIDRLIAERRHHYSR